MAVKVVGTAKDKVRRVTCLNCASKLEFLNSDVQQRDYKDMAGVTDTTYWIVCPQCKETITVSAR